MRKQRTIWLLLLAAAFLLCVPGCGRTKDTEAGEEAADDDQGQALQWSDLKLDQSMELDYAEQFSVDYDQDGYALLTITDTGRFLVVPDGGEIPLGLPEDLVVLQQP